MTATTYLEWEDQTNGSNNNTWGDVSDANSAIFEQAIARYLPLSTTGGSTTLTSSQNRYPIIVVSGVLASNATIVVRTAEKNWTIKNVTTGNFTLTVKTAAGREGMDFYELRHYCATRLLERGVSDADVAVALGHTDGGELVRRVYGHPAERHSLDRVRDAMRRAA